MGDAFIDAEIWYLGHYTYEILSDHRCGRGNFLDAQQLVLSYLDDVEMALVRYTFRPYYSFAEAIQASRI